jgi:hypothetical protein
MTNATFTFCPDAAAAAAALVADSTQFTVSNAAFSGICNMSTASTTNLGQLGIINNFGPCHYLKVGHQAQTSFGLVAARGQRICTCIVQGVCVCVARCSDASIASYSGFSLSKPNLHMLPRCRNVLGQTAVL